MELYHGTTIQIKNRFHRLTHFGTRRAARQRAIRLNPGECGSRYIYKVEFNPGEKPLQILDYSTERNKAALCRHMLRRAGMGEWEINDLFFEAGDVESGISLAIQTLEEKGYTAASYENRNEDFGSTSWVNFRQGQVEIQSHTELEKQEKR